MEFQNSENIEPRECKSWYGIIEQYLFPKEHECKWMQYMNNISLTKK